LIHYKQVGSYIVAFSIFSYTFQSIGLLRRAMTHGSFSEENNRALSILGANVIETFVSLRSLGTDIDISAKELNRRIAEISTVESSCLVDGMRLGLQKVVRVSPKTNSSTPAVVCGAFRAIFGAIAIDTGKSDDAGKVFWSVHGGNVGGAFAF
jgi:dsRNA-specific ribonuclease